jgi:hypothetical protein
VAAEEEVVGGCDGERVAHEGDSVDDQATGHGAGDTAKGCQRIRAGTIWAAASRIQNIHFRVLLGVHHSSERNTEVGDGAPEVCEGS